MKRIACLLCCVMVGMALTLSGCCGRSGTTDVKAVTTTTTLGEELTKLKEAHDQGILTDQEYVDAKEKLIRQRTAEPQQ